MPSFNKEFRHGSHLIHQDIFKAETPDHNLYVGYDDVDDGVYLVVTWKWRWLMTDTPLPYPRSVTMKCGSVERALGRVSRFLRQHPISEPRCDVDY